jgi:5-methylcytosine-specific restriction endonuclease McrA
MESVDPKILKAREWRARWRKKNPGYSNRWAKKNPEKVKASREKSSGKNTARALEWQKNNPERRREIAREWARKNISNVTENTRRRRMRIRSVAIVIFSKQNLLLRLSMFSGCWICGGRAEEIDHVKPIAKGGIHILSNLRPICRFCNRSKGSKWRNEEVDIYKKIHSIK